MAANGIDQSTAEIVRNGRWSGFTLVELIGVLLIIGVLGGIAVPEYLKHTENAKESADKGAISGIQTALSLEYVTHRAEGSPSSERITSVNDIAEVMITKKLPDGITIVGTKLQDQRGNTYTFIAETATDPAIIRLD